MQPELFEKCWEPTRYEAFPGMTDTCTCTQKCDDVTFNWQEVWTFWIFRGADTAWCGGVVTMETMSEHRLRVTITGTAWECHRARVLVDVLAMTAAFPSFSCRLSFPGGGFNHSQRGRPRPRCLRQHVCAQQLQAWPPSSETGPFWRYPNHEKPVHNPEALQHTNERPVMQIQKKNQKVQSLKNLQS